MDTGSFGGAYAAFMDGKGLLPEERPPVRFVNDAEVAYVATRYAAKKNVLFKGRCRQVSPGARFLARADGMSHQYGRRVSGQDRRRNPGRLSVLGTCVIVYVV